MEEINLKQLFSYFIGKLYLVLLIVLISIICGTIYIFFIQVPMYKSSTTIVLTGSTSNDGEASSSISQQEVSLNEKLVSTYSGIIKSRKVMSQVITNLNLNTTVEDLSKNVTVTNDDDTAIIRISVVNEDANMSSNIANEIADVFSKEIVNIFDIRNVTIIDRAIVPDKAYNINHLKSYLITVLIGLVLAFVIVFVMFYFDTTIKDTETIENMGFTVLGTIPVGKNKKEHSKKGSK